MNRKYGKLDEGVLIFAPVNLVIDDMQVINADEADYLAAGYLPIEYKPKPDDNEWQAVYTEVDGVILQSWVYEGRIHDHSNLDILEDVNVKSLSGIPAVHTLPTDAKDGDMCLYSPMNVFESGKRIYFDWHEFAQSVEPADGSRSYTIYGQARYNYDNPLAWEVGTPFIFSSERGKETNDFTIEITTREHIIGYGMSFDENGNLYEGAICWKQNFADETEEEIYYSSIDELPKYIDIPEYDYFDENPNLTQLEAPVPFFYAPYRLMVYRAGEWNRVETLLDIEGGSVDLSDYYTKQEIDDKGFVTADEVFDYTAQENFTNVIKDKTFVVGKGLVGSTGDFGDIGSPNGSACEDYIPVSSGDIIRMKDICLRLGKSTPKIVLYDANYNYIFEITPSKTPGYYFDVLETDENGNLTSVVLKKPSTIAYMRIAVWTDDIGKNPIVTINEEITFEMGYGNKLNSKIKVDQSQILNAPQKNCWSILPNEHLNIAYSQILRRKPINTVEHFVDMCENFNFNVLKTDVEPTSDGELVCCHDKGFTFDDNGNVTIYNAENSTLIHDVTAEMCISYTHPTGEHVCLVGDYLRVCRKYGKVAFITIRERYMDVVIPKLINELKKHDMLYSTIINSMTYNSLVEWRNRDTSVMINYTLNSGQNITQETIDKVVELGYCSHCGFGFNGTTSTPNMECDFEYAREKGVRLLQAIAYVKGSVENAYDLGYDGCQIAYEWNPIENIEIAKPKLDNANDTILQPNIHYNFGTVETLTLTFAEGEADKVNEYSFSFVSGENATVLTLPSSVQWVNELTVEANKRYEISIVDNIGLWCAVDLAVTAE